MARHADDMQQNPARPIAGKLEVCFHWIRSVSHSVGYRYSLIA